MRLYKEITKLREEIERNESTTIKFYGREGADIERFIKLMSHGWNCGNAVKFAIRRKSLGCVEEIFKILMKSVREQPQIRYILQSLNKDITRLARTKKVHAEGDALIVNAIKYEQHIPAKILLESLEDEQRYDVIKQKERCKRDCSGNTHGEGCKAGYNLLMLALETSPDDGSLPLYIVDFVCQHRDLTYKMEIAVGKREPEIYDQTPNSIRLAAATGKTRLAIRLLKNFLPPEECYRAFLEVGPPKSPEVSAMASMLEVNDIESLEMLGEENQGEENQGEENQGEENQGEENQGEENQGEENQGEALRQILKNSAGIHNNFLELKMKQDAIEQFDIIQALENKYLIPKPSELSRPMALIFYNTFAGADRPLPGTEQEAVCLNNALQNLGWGDDEITISPQWTFDQLINQLENSIKNAGKRCSLFLLYITSHGKADRVYGISESEDKNKYTSGSIDEIIGIVTLLPTYIPKVIIFDTCRTGGRTRLTTTDKNTLLLHATTLGQTAAQNLYIPELASQIIEMADNRVPFHKIHITAAQNIASTRPQKPVSESIPKKDIVLRRYDGNENNCMRCKTDIKNCYRECLICSNCFRWYHVACAGCTQADIALSKRSKLAKLKCPKCLEYALG